MSRIVRPEEGVPLRRFDEPAFGEGAPEQRESPPAAFTTPADILRYAQDEADALVARARDEADSIRRHAEAAGRAAGEAAGLREARTRYDDAIATLSAVVQELRADHERYKAEAANDIIEIALAIVRRVLGDYVEQHPDVMAHVVGEALRALPKREVVTVRVHPSLVDAVREQRTELLAAYENASDLSVVADEGVALGGCMLDTESVNIDATIGIAVERLRAALREEIGEREGEA